MADGNEIGLPEMVRRLERAERELESLWARTSKHETLLSNFRLSADRFGKEIRQCVKRADFQPVQRVVYGIVGLILIAVMTALVGLVLKTKP